MVVSTAEHLMNCGFRVVYGYKQSDEISLLFHPEYERPMKDQYGDFILRLIEDSIESE